MTGTDGFVLLKRIRNLNKDIKVLFLSSKSEAFYAGRAIRAGANGFVSKRKDLGEIYNAVEMILTGYKRHFSGVPGERAEQEEEMYVKTRPLQYILQALSGDNVSNFDVITNIDDHGYDFYRLYNKSWGSPTDRRRK